MTGVIITTFRRGGQIGYGSLAVEEPAKEEIARREKLAKESAR